MTALVCRCGQSGIHRCPWPKRAADVHYPGDYAHVRRCAKCQSETTGSWWRPAAEQHKGNDDA